MFLLFAAGAVSGAFTFAAYSSAMPGNGIGGEDLIPLLLVALFAVGWYSHGMFEIARQSMLSDLPCIEEESEPVVMMPDDTDTAYYEGYSDGWRDANETLSASYAMTARPRKKSRPARCRKAAKQERSTQNGKKKDPV